MIQLRALLDTEAVADAVIDRSATVEDAARRMKAHHRCALVVTDRDRRVGIITRRDVFERVIARHRSPQLGVDEIMSRELVEASLDMPIQDALALMNKNHIRHLVVVDGDDRLAGLLTRVELISSVMAEREAHIGDLMFYITHG